MITTHKTAAYQGELFAAEEAAGQELLFDAAGLWSNGPEAVKNAPADTPRTATWTRIAALIGRVSK